MLVDSYIVIASKLLHYWSLPVAADTELQLTGMHVTCCSCILLLTNIVSVL